MRKTRVQTEAPQGTYKRGDPHPSIPNRYFNRYRWNPKGLIREHWLSEDALKDCREKVVQYAKDNKDIKRGIAKRWRDKNAGYHKAYNLQYRAKIKSRTEDLMVCNHFYVAAQRIAKCLGVSFHVDHIQPVSKGGEHNPKNLQIVPAKWNLSKSNKNNDRFPYNTSPTQEFS